MSYREQYAHLTHHIVPGPQGLSYFLPIVLLPIALLIPRTVLPRWQSAALFLPIVLGSSVHAWMQMECVDVISVNVVLWGLYFFVLKDVHRTFRRVEWRGSGDGSRVSNGLLKGGEDRQDENHLMVQRYPENTKNRLLWIGNLLASTRMNNWLTGEPSHDRRQPPPPAFKTRSALAKQAIVSFVRGYLVLDITTAYIAHDPYFTNASIPITSPNPALPDLSPWAIYVLRTLVIGLQGWATLSQFTYILCLLPLALNAAGVLPDAWSPHTWAPLYGSVRTVLTHGLKGFWSSYWHQSMRITTSAPGYAIADALGVRRGGLGKFAVITSVAFFCSGVVHMGLVPPEPLFAVERVGWVRLRVGAFFWLQPGALLVEAGAGRVLGRVLSPEWRRSRQGMVLRMGANVLFLWAWSLVCLPLLGDLARQIGYWHMLRMPVSLVQYLATWHTSSTLFRKMQSASSWKAILS